MTRREVTELITRTLGRGCQYSDKRKYGFSLKYYGYTSHEEIRRLETVLEENCIDATVETGGTRYDSRHNWVAVRVHLP